LCGGRAESSNSVVRFTSSLKTEQADRLRFTVGVPFDDNHKNPLTQPSPLNLPLMFWSWQLGHKFVRWDMTKDASSWSFHLGSLGCESVSSVRAPGAECSEPNTVEIVLNKPNMNTNSIWVHLDRIVEGLDLADNSSCVLHDTTEHSCATLIQNLQYNEVFEWR
jgi:uncharacterized repeat protein (TIGR04052 family)